MFVWKSANRIQEALVDVLPPDIQAICLDYANLLPIRHRTVTMLNFLGLNEHAGKRCIEHFILDMDNVCELNFPDASNQSRARQEAARANLSATLKTRKLEVSKVLAAGNKQIQPMVLIFPKVNYDLISSAQWRNLMRLIVPLNLTLIVDMWPDEKVHYLYRFATYVLCDYPSTLPRKWRKRRGQVKAAEQLWEHIQFPYIHNALLYKLGVGRRSPIRFRFKL